ncbi:MAG: hypothetical protein ACOCTL_02405 [Candidatus Hadarchaeota archaeon]
MAIKKVARNRRTPAKKFEKYVLNPTLTMNPNIKVERKRSQRGRLGTSGSKTLAAIGNRKINTLTANALFF